MGLVECIFCKIYHIIEYAVGHLRVYALGDTAGNLLLLIPVDEVRPLLLHNGMLLLAHGPANQIAAPHGVPAQIPHDLHHLLLIDDTPIGGRQNSFQLRAGIGYDVLVAPAFNIFGDGVHGARPVQRNAVDDIFHASGPKLLHEILHAAALQLEDALRLARSDVGKYLLVLIVKMVQINLPSRGFLYELHRILNHRQRAQPQKVHLQKPQLLQRGHGELSGDGPVAPSGQGHELVCSLRADHHPRGMHGGVSRQPFQTLAHIDEMPDLLVLLIHPPQLRVHFQRPIQRNVQLSGHQLRNGIHHGIGQIHDTSHVPNDSLCRQGSEGDDLHHLIGAILLTYIVNDLLPAVVAEIHINIRHGNPLRIQESLKEKVVSDGIDIRNPKAVGHNAACGGSPARPHRNAVASGIVDKVPHDQEIVHISHGPYNR